MVNPYLIEDNKPSDILLFTLDYYGVSLDKFKTMSDEQVRTLVKKFSDVLNDGEVTVTRPHGGDGGKLDTRDVGWGFRRLSSDMSDFGSKSRYFDLDAWAKHHGFLNVPKASTSERDQGLNGFEEKDSGVLKGSLDGSLVGERGNRIEGKSPVRKNIHPTVKPVRLMAYLIELGCPKDGIVCDPFLGSGTTCMAAKMLGRKYIGIELEKEYYDIAVARVNATFPIQRGNSG